MAFIWILLLMLIHNPNGALQVCFDFLEQKSTCHQLLMLCFICFLTVASVVVTFFGANLQNDRANESSVLLILGDNESCVT